MNNNPSDGVESIIWQQQFLIGEELSHGNMMMVGFELSLSHVDGRVLSELEVLSERNVVLGGAGVGCSVYES